MTSFVLLNLANFKAAEYNWEIAIHSSFVRLYFSLSSSSSLSFSNLCLFSFDLIDCSSFLFTSRSSFSSMISTVSSVKEFERRRRCLLAD